MKLTKKNDLLWKWKLWTICLTLGIFNPYLRNEMKNFVNALNIITVLLIMVLMGMFFQYVMTAAVPCSAFNTEGRCSNFLQE